MLVTEKLDEFAHSHLTVNNVWRF